MCIFSGHVSHVGGTKIFARLKADGANRISQFLVYSMNVSTTSDVAMILPLPVSSHAENAITFISLDGYPEFFKNMETGFPKPRSKGLVSRSLALAAGAAPSVLEVHEVGEFIASFVPSQSDFERLDERFRLPTSTWDKVPQYRDWGFAVFQLKATSARTTKTIHPMAFVFPTRLAEALYFPTLHIHDGTVSEQADFDHTLYFQGEPFQDFAHDISPTKAVKFMKVGKAKGIVDPDTVCGKRSVIGRRANADVYARLGETN